ncbi:MAG: PDZ domain-containing protein [Pyrinomonadaceae bacterium]|nr:PDZ domain-containing protein [Pyrinomonadaceae bacterium]MBP9110880.1 PDZ domain-containing protein [Pyrinomonadaceae bacterium]
MSFRGKLWVLMISGVVAVYAVVGGLPLVNGLLSASAQQPVNDATAQLKIVESVLQHIQNDYVDEPNMEKVRLGALRGLAGGLDPYSAYLTTEQVKAYEANKTAPRVGIGAEFSQISGYLYVISAIKGSPAEKAGIKNGDVIEYIDGKASRDISLYDAKQLVDGEAGSTISLRVLRAGEKAQTIKVVRGSYKVPQAESRIENGRIGVIKVYSLEDGEANDIKTQIGNLTKQGVGKIILDLRGVAAGKITEGAAVANLFIKSGEIARVIGKDSKVLTTYTADPAKAVFDGGLAVLTDIGTAGAAEVVAAAVLDKKRGEVIGERTFGLGTEQKLFPMTSGGGYLLTIAKWAAPNGTPFLGDDRATTGIKPSIEVKRPDTPEPLDIEALAEPQEPNPAATPTPTPTPKPAQPKVVEDIQLKKALEVLGGLAAKAAA